jgi:hypothetical protein
MNDQITLLALKASDPKTGWLDRQKFAELIVRECANVADKYVVDGDWHIAEIIKKHFGVTE